MPNVTTVLGPLYADEQGIAGEPVVLLWPSLFADHHMWHHQVAALRERGWRTIALDPPGHGRSPGPGRVFTMDECADAVLQVLDALDVYTPITFLGTSWGGFVGPRVAARAPERVDAMVLTNTSAERGNALERTRATVLTKLMAIGALDTMTARMIMAGLLAPETRRRQPDIGADLSQRLSAWDRPGVITTVRSVLVDRTPVLDALSEVSTPTLILSGQKDRTLPTEHSLRIAETMPNARHVEVPNAAHLIPLEAPDHANSLILDFLQQLGGADPVASAGDDNALAQ